MSMFRKVLMTIGLLLMANLVLAQGTIKGTVIDSKTKEPVAFANVVATQDGKQIKAGRTDLDGNFTIKPLDVGQYDVSVSSVGYNPYTWKGFNVKASGVSVCNIEMSSGAVTLDDVIIEDDKNPIIDVGSAESGKRINSEDIKHMPGTSIDNIVAAVGGVGYDDGGSGAARGEGNMVTNVGGVRKRTSIQVPKDAIAEIQVILGGTPASIGEAIGGTQVITLKPPTSQFHGSLTYRGYLDYRYYNYFGLYLTGPVITKPIKDENGEVTGKSTLVGFRLTGEAQYEHNSFYRPNGYNYRVVNDALVREIEQSPISYDPVTGTVNYTAETGLYADDFVTIRKPSKKDFGGDASRVPNTQYYSVATQLALDFRFTDYANLVITGDFNFYHSPSNSISPLNMPLSANSVTRHYGWGITADFTQRFPDPETSADNTDGESKGGRAISNVMYKLVGMYEISYTHAYNEAFGNSVDDAFKYGYNGRLETNQQPTYELNPSFNYDGVSRAAYVQNNWYDIIDWSTYEPYAPNQLLANYNLQLLNIPDIAGNLLNLDNLRYYKGLPNGEMPGNIYGRINNVGVQSGSLAFSRNQYIYLTAMAKADIKGHTLEVGFQYDRVDESYYYLDASKLWTIMRQNANRHISQMDLENPHFRWEGSNLYVDYDRLYNGEAQSHFDRAMRDYLGWSGNYEGERTYLDVDRYTPEQYIEAGGIDMFSADELFNNSNSLVSYYGYDHTGKKYSSANWKLDDFFNPAGDNAKYRYLPSFHPTYMAGYVQDQFYFSDLIFNIGVRVDIFDSEQQVLKDPYLLYESYTVGDLKNGIANYQGDIYAGAADDWTVYVDAADADVPTIYGYRSGSTWYDVNGVEQASPTSIAGKSGKPTPYRTPDGQLAMSQNTVAVSAFTDYKPQVVVMPRIAFSFPVGDNSQFKASYDIISRRPSSAWQASYLSYLYMSQVSAVSNPNLKPERITNYELDFEQALNKNSAISVAAYYKETRDLIQLVQYAGADPNQNYYSYDNIDFKTIKGLTLSYDLRQSKNVRINANYTLQYAEGTGLPQATMTELIKEGYTTLKMLNPIGEDRRHEFKVNIDYRYGEGKAYNGPHINRKVKDKETGEERVSTVNILENFGVDILAVAQSGAPYTRAFSHNQYTIVGSYNGARLPWGFYLDLQLDKSFPIKVGPKHKPTYLAVILTLKNPLNLRNVRGVYNVTGNAEDDGYLTDPETQTVINSYLDPQSFRDLYTITSMNGTWHYNNPRTILLQLSYSF